MNKFFSLPFSAIIILVVFILVFSGCSSRQRYGDQGGGGCPASGQAHQITVDPALLETLIEINNEIGQTADVKAKLNIVVGSQPNAFAWNKGKKNYIALNSALLAILKENIDEYAFVIAHETAHISQGHLSKRKKYKEGVGKTSGVLSLALEMVGIGLGIPFSGLISSLTTDSGAHLMALGYNRDQEREADKEGLNYLIQSGFNPNGAITFLQKLQALPDRSSIPFLSTHPLSDERVTLLRNILKDKKLIQTTSNK